MGIGNFVLGGSCIWGANCLQVPATGYCVSEGAFNPSSDGSFSVEVAFNLVAMGGTYQCVLSQASAYTLRSAGNDRFCIYITSSKIYAKVKMQNSTSNTYIANLTGPSVVAGGNYIVDLVCDGVSVKLYVNGQLYAEAAFNYVEFTSSVKLGISCWTNANGQTGTVSSYQYNFYAINLYTRALTPEEIEDNVQNIVSRFGLTL